jgi:beta-xylosidase
MSMPALPLTRSCLGALAACLILFGAVPGRAANPFITSIFTADPSAHVWSDGRLYVYPSRDIDPARGCDLMDHYHVFSTDNMVDWRDEGEILNSSQVAWGRKEGGFMWAPDAACRNGTYYFYFPHPSDTKWNDSWKIGVATSTRPASDFKDAGYIKGAGGFAMIDPAVFMDADGQAYLYYGGGGHCSGVKLKPDMTEIEGEPQPMTGLTDFHEATWVFKRDKLYYLTYADNHPDHNQMQYATSSSPLGPWTSHGVYLEATDCDTTHGSAVEFKGQWYQFYHNKSISGQGNLRSICVDRLDFNDDGTLKTVVQTKTGPPAAGPADDPNPSAVRYGTTTATVDGGATIEISDPSNGSNSIQNLHLDGASVLWSKVSGGDLGGRATIDLSYAAQDNAKIHLDVNGVDYSLLNVLATGDWNKYSGHTSLTMPLNPGNGNVIKLSGGYGGVNLDHITVTPLP